MRSVFPFLIVLACHSSEKAEPQKTPPTEEPKPFGDKAMDAVVLQSNDANDIKAVSQALKAAKIPYVISKTIDEIKVAKADLGKARIAASSVEFVNTLKGIVEQNESNEHRWAYFNRLSGELTRTINSLDEVAASRVHIVQSDDSPFLNRDTEASAIVTVKLKKGWSLSAAQIKGVTQLVAASAGGLDASNVVLIDTTGRVLSDSPPIKGNSPTALNQKHERLYRNKILNDLGQILGSTRHVTAAVSVEVYEKTSSTERNPFDPNSQVVISEKITESSTKEDTPIGIPGPESNLPEQDPVGIPGSESNLPEQTPAFKDGASQEKFSSATNYDYTQETKNNPKTPGDLKSVSVSVSVNLQPLEDLVASSNEALSLDDYKFTIETVVKTVIGFSESRGDQVSIMFYRFAELSTDTLEDQ